MRYVKVGSVSPWAGKAVTSTFDARLIKKAFKFMII